MKEKARCPFCGDGAEMKPFMGLDDVLRCSCGLVLARTRIVREDFRKLYSKEYFISSSSEALGYDDYVGDKELVVKTFRKRLRLIEKKWARKKGRLLDVGSATGFSLIAAMEMGWEAQGVEISDYCCKYAKTNFGLDIQNGFFDEAQFPRESFDLVTMWDYIEHTANPVFEIQKARELLRAGGTIALTTPDVGSVPARLLKKRWIGFKEDEHLYYFSKQSATRLLENSGFKVVHCKYTGKYISYDFFAKRLACYSKPIARAAHRITKATGLAHRSFYCNPFEIILVVGKKT